MFRTVSMAAAAALMVVGASAQADVKKIRLEPFVSGLHAPLALVQPAGDSGLSASGQWASGIGQAKEPDLFLVPMLCVGTP